MCIAADILVAALDIKTRDVTTIVVTILQSFAIFFLQIFMYRGGANVRFAPIVPWAKAGPEHTQHDVSNDIFYFNNL
jgi:hypothetical protein